MSLKNKIVYGTAVLSIGALTVGAIKGLKEQVEYEQTRREVQLVIDEDSNRVITPKEWKKVYNFLEVNPQEYSLGTGYGLELSKTQLESYLEHVRK